MSTDPNRTARTSVVVPQGALTADRIGQRVIEVIREKPVIREVYQDIEEEVIIERPVENIIEREVYIDRVVEVPREVEVFVDKEVIREEYREIPVTREVPIVREVEIPVEKIRHVPIDVIVEKEVRVPVYVDKVVDRTKIKPVEHRVVFNEIVNEIPVYTDQIREVPVQIDVPVYVDKINEIRVEKPFVTEVEVPVYIDKVVTQEIPIDVVTEVTRPYITEVEIPVYVDKYVDRPYTVDVIQDVIVEVPVVHEVEKPVYIDKVVEKPVDRIVEIPVQIDKNYNIIMERVTEKPAYESYDVVIEYPVFQDKAIHVERETEQPYETIVERSRIEVDFPRVVERPVTDHVEIPVDRLRQEIKTVDRYVDVPLEKLRVVEKVQDTVKEVEVPLTRVIEKTKIVPKVIERYVDKYVDTYVYVTNPIYKEVVVEAPATEKQVTLTTTLERLNVVSVPVARPMNTVVKGQALKQSQIDRFNRAGMDLAKVVEENIKLQASVDGLRNAVSTQSSLFRVTPQMLEELRRREQQLRSSIDAISQENAKLRSQLSREPELEQKVEYDSELVPVLREQIRVVREHNENLRGLARKGAFNSTTRQIGREFAGEVVHRPNSYYSGSKSRSSSYSSGSASRSLSPAPIRVAAASHLGQPARVFAAEPLVRTARPQQVTFAPGVVHGRKVARATSPLPTRTVVNPPGSRVIVHDPRPSGPIRRGSSYSGSGSYYSSSPSRSRGSTLSPQPVRVVAANREPVIANRYQSRVDSLLGQRLPAPSTGTSVYTSGYVDRQFRPAPTTYTSNVQQGPNQSIMDGLATKVTAHPAPGAAAYTHYQQSPPVTSFNSTDNNFGIKRDLGSSVGTADNSLFEGIARSFNNHERLLANVQNPFRR